jgi:mRNA-degrading endonuclease RelE of RelBE toxin-antitoxin system
VPKFSIIAHHRVQKFLSSIKDENLKLAIIQNIIKLEDYPLSLRDMDIEKIRGIEKTFRIRTGKYRIIFHVDNSENKIYVTHVEPRKKAYTKRG